MGQTLMSFVDMGQTGCPKIELDIRSKNNMYFIDFITSSFLVSRSVSIRKTVNTTIEISEKKC